MKLIRYVEKKNHEKKQKKSEGKAQYYAQYI